MTIDSRPSDSIALAVREKCPVYISDAVVEEAGVSVAEISETSAKEGEEGAEEPQTEMDRLKNALNKAVEEENYEEAARIRDRINEIEGS
jgi:bifunctional DNase/RNase